MPVAARWHRRLRGRDDAATRYGRLRLWGSAGFVIVVMAAGPVFDRFGIGSALWLGVALCAVLVATAWRIEEQPVHEVGHERVSVSRRLREPRVRWFLLSGTDIRSRCAVHGPIYLAQLGYSKARSASSGCSASCSKSSSRRGAGLHGSDNVRCCRRASWSPRYLLADCWLQPCGGCWSSPNCCTPSRLCITVHRCLLSALVPGPGRCAGQPLYQRGLRHRWHHGQSDRGLPVDEQGTAVGFCACIAAALLGAWAVRRARLLDVDGGPHEVALVSGRST
jgi:hypothetical protein